MPHDKGTRQQQGHRQVCLFHRRRSYRGVPRTSPDCQNWEWLKPAATGYPTGRRKGMGASFLRLAYLRRRERACSAQGPEGAKRK